MVASDQWVRRTELPERYPIPIGTWERWAYLRTGPPYVRVGRHALYRLADVEAWLAEHGVETSSTG